MRLVMISIDLLYMGGNDKRKLIILIKRSFLFCHPSDTCTYCKAGCYVKQFDSLVPFLILDKSRALCNTQDRLLLCHLIMRRWCQS